MDLGCGITLDIFTHVYYTGRLKFIRIYTYVKEIQVGDLDDGYNVVTCLKEETFTPRLGVALT